MVDILDERYSDYTPREGRYKLHNDLLEECAKECDDQASFFKKEGDLTAVGILLGVAERLRSKKVNLAAGGGIGSTKSNAEVHTTLWDGNDLDGLIYGRCPDGQLHDWDLNWGPNGTCRNCKKPRRKALR